jgi:putative ABC transport system ATP-binding protein
MSLEVMALFQELRHTGITVALVTHEPDIAEYASRVVVVKDGKIIEDRTQTPKAVVLPPPMVQPAAASSGAAKS